MLRVNVMSDSKEILLNSSNSKISVNKDILLDVDLSVDEKKFPSNGISSNIDQYRQYIKEKDESNKYRFVFTINPVCSNVLYNHVTEVIAKTQGGKTVRIESSGRNFSGTNNKYIKYKYNSINYKITQLEAIKDTGYSHPKCGNFTYFPGIDIFNNHRFRNKEFVVVAGKGNDTTCVTYNTIEDTQREYNGDVLKTIAVYGGEKDTHLYYKDTIKTFTESLMDNLIERDGWFGFINKASLDVNNCKIGDSEISINKILNNRGSCEFIDMYPDRTLFSFVPNKNKELNREEYNWDYCITYPYKNFYDNELVSLIKDGEPVLNGILTEFCDLNGNKLTEEGIEGLLDITGMSEDFSDVMLKTKIKNNIKSGDYVKIHLVNKDSFYTIKTNVKVRNVGIGGYSTIYYFTVNKGDIISGIKSLKESNDLDGLHCYVQRVVSGRPCKYYFRKFRRLPNFKNTGISNISRMSDNAISSAMYNNFNSSLNKLGFGTNVYGDRMAQIVFNDDVDTTNLYDNLGRELHEVYLTLIKTNRGNKEWYINKEYSSKNVECSHCFSDVTSGIDMPWPYIDGEEDNYNVHKLHNIEESFDYVPEPQLPLEKGITCSGSTKDGTTYNGVFLGDIIELDELGVEEYVLETVQHRFNTMQREDVSGEFSAITINEIISDDYDGAFKVSNDPYITGEWVNIAPEGYYYKPHYQIKIREFSDVVNEGQHTIVNFTSINSEIINETTVVTATTDKNYYFQKSNFIYIYDTDRKRHIGQIDSVTGSDFTNIVFKMNEILYIDDNNKSLFKFFKPNSEMPPTAYDFNDGSGIYRWRDIESFEYIRQDSELYDSVFTNGAHYIHKNINFYLKRQDPYGYYGLNMAYNEELPYEGQILEQTGNEKDITPAQHFTEGDIQLC